MIGNADAQAHFANLCAHRTSPAMNWLEMTRNVTCCVLLLKPELSHIDAIQLGNERITNYTFWPTSSLNKYEPITLPVHKAHQTVVSLWGQRRLNNNLWISFTSDPAVFFVVCDVAIWSKMSLIAEHNFVEEMKISGDLVSNQFVERMVGMMFM